MAEGVGAAATSQFAVVTNENCNDRVTTLGLPDTHAGAGTPGRFVCREKPSRECRSVRVWPLDDLVGSIDDHQFNGIARRTGPHHLRGQPVDLRECCRHGVMLAA